MSWPRGLSTLQLDAGVPRMHREVLSHTRLLGPNWISVIVSNLEALWRLREDPMHCGPLSPIYKLGWKSWCLRLLFDQKRWNKFPGIQEMQEKRKWTKIKMTRNSNLLPEVYTLTHFLCKYAMYCIVFFSYIWTRNGFRKKMKQWSKPEELGIFSTWGEDTKPCKTVLQPRDLCLAMGSSWLVWKKSLGHPARYRGLADLTVTSLSQLCLWAATGRERGQPSEGY